MVAMKLSLSPSSVRIRGLADGPRGKVWGRFPIGGKSSQGNYNRPRAELRLDIKDWSFSSIGLRAGFLLIQLFGVDVFCGLVVWNSKMFIFFPM